MMDECIFCAIVAGRSPASVVYRDESCLAFMDIRPINPGHLLVIPILHATFLTDLQPEVGRAIFGAAHRLAGALRRSGLHAAGINLFLADGEVAGQEVFHIHLHVIPRFSGDGFGLRFAPSYGQHPPRQELDATATRIKMVLKLS